MSSPTSFPPAVVTSRHPTIPGDQVPAQRGALAILSHLRRDADWILPRLFRVFAFWGNAEIDLTHALVGEGTSVIEVKCIMASVEIRVPPDLRVANEVEAVIGSADIRRGAPTTAAPGAPTIRITGSSFLGSVEIKIVDPNAPALIERIRRRLTT